MKSWKITSNNPIIAQYVQCYWLIEKEPTDTSHNFPKLNPDPSATLLLSPENQQFRYKQHRQEFSVKGCHWIFPNSQTIQLDHSQPFVILGIKFHIGALYSLDILPKQPVIDEIINVDIQGLIHNNSVNDTSLFFDFVDNAEQCCKSLDELLIPWLSKFQPDNHHKLTVAALDLLTNHQVSELGKLLHCSQRTLERSFTRVTGFTLKQCQSMQRFELILERLYQLKTQEINWLDIVDEFNFSDQPHLIRHLKNMIGDTPNEYKRKRDLTIDIYGDFKTS